MIKLVVYSGCVFFACIFSQPSWALDQDADGEFEIKKQYEMEKIEDFYTRLNELDRMDAERRSGESEMRKERLETIKASEAARQEFVKARRARPVEDSAEWENEVKARAREYELARKAFVKKRDDMNRALKGVGRIPEADEYDINTEHE